MTYSSLRKYDLELIQSAGLLNVKPSNIPFNPLTKLKPKDGDLIRDPSTYRAIVRKLLYLTITRPDISYAAQALKDQLLSSSSPSPGPWMKCLLKDLGIQISSPIPIFYDNASAIALASNPVQHARTKHIEIDCHVVRDKIKAGQVLPKFVPTTDQAADVLTKGLYKAPHYYCLSKFGICDPYTLPTCRGG
ncbi:cysteine-rich receptor-like protein kinase 8 [Tanacetum coccineum]